MGIPSMCITLPPSNSAINSVCLWLDAMSTSESWVVNKYTLHWAIPVSVLWLRAIEIRATLWVLWLGRTLLDLVVLDL